MKLPSVKIAQLAELARIAKASRRFLALYGKGGVGKTSVARSIIAPALDVAPEDVWIVNLSGSGPQEATGYLIPDSATRDGWFSVPECWPTAKRIGDDRPVLLVLDEYPEWDASIQSLCRSLFDPSGGAPKIGVHELASGVQIVVTGNRRADGSRSAVPSAPFVERCLSVLVQPTLDEWLDWAAINGLAASPVYPFLKFQGGDQHAQPVDHFNPDVPTPWDGSPHPCPRAWEAACRATVGDLSPELAALAIEGLVGETAGRAAVAFIRLVGDLMPQLTAIRSGASAMPTDPASQQAIAHAALRIAKKEAGADPEAAVASGALDWLVSILLAVRAEIRAYGYATAVACGIRLDQHPQRSAMQGV